MQVFVSDKGYEKINPMKSTSGFMAALKYFAKEVGAPKILVDSPHPFHNSKEVNYLYNKIGTTLRLLEQVTQWANLEKLYVGF